MGAHASWSPHSAIFVRWGGSHHLACVGKSGEALALAALTTPLQRVHVLEKFGVVAGLAELVDQQFHGFHGR